MKSILVIGGGPAGATAARLLAHHDFDVSIITAKKSETFEPGETLPPVANPLLERLGLMDILKHGPHISCPGNQSIFGSSNVVDFDFLFSANGMGWHLDRVAFEKQLLDLAAKSGVKILNQAKVKSTQYINGKWKIFTEHNDPKNLEIETLKDMDYIIEASGKSRIVLKNLKVDILKQDKLAARSMVFHTQATKRDHRTLIESAPNGWWYSACLPHDMRVVMYFSDSDLEVFRSIKTKQNFLNELATTSLIFQRLESEKPYEIKARPSPICTYSCSSAYAQQCQGHNWIAIGDALMSFDPLSSQGLWTALESADRAVSSILNLEKNNQDNLKDYCNWVNQTFSRYLTEKRNYYAMETRWNKTSFWNRRLN